MTTKLAQPVARQLWAAIRMIVVMTVLLGLAYPMVMTGVAQVAFSDHADGSLVERDGAVIGSSLVGQGFDARPDYFQTRPSAAGQGYDPLSTSASNLGPENPDLLAAIEQRRTAAAELDGTAPGDIAPDALLASASGLDPHISPEYAEQQVVRVAAARGLDVAQVQDLVDENTIGRSLGFLGEPRVNVLLLNLALDEATGRAD